MVSSSKIQSLHMEAICFPGNCDYKHSYASISLFLILSKAVWFKINRSSRALGILTVLRTKKETSHIQYYEKLNKKKRAGGVGKVL